MHDPSNASSRPSGQAIPPPLPRRVEACVEAVSRTQIDPRSEPEIESRADTAGHANVQNTAAVRAEPPIQLRIEPLPTAPAGDFIPTTLSPKRKLAFYWGGGGFITGIVFWHAVGFWDAVQSAMFSGTAVDASRVERPIQQAATPASFADAIDRAISSASSENGSAPIMTGSLNHPRLIDSDGNNCTSFTRDPESGQVQSRPCSSGEHMLPQNPDGGRRNFASQGSTPVDSRWLRDRTFLAVE